MGRNIKVVFKVLSLVGFCFYLLFGVSTITRVPIQPTASVGVFMAKQGTTSRHEGLVYVSRRKIPNGPDPIHNRKIGNDRQSPERA